MESNARFQNAITTQNFHTLDWAKAWSFHSERLLPCTVQDPHSGKVLMQGYMTQESVKRTLECGKVTFFSRSKQALWTKGETSGHFLLLHSMFTDCDRDSLLILAHPKGPTCHQGTESCFESASLDSDLTMPLFGQMGSLWNTIQSRLVEGTEDSYTKKLVESGLDRVLKKLTEEAGEVILAAKNAASTSHSQELLEESADLLYHWLLIFGALKLNPVGTMEVLKKRAKSR